MEEGRLPGRVEAVNTARSLVVGGGGPTTRESTTRESRGGEHSRESRGGEAVNTARSLVAGGGGPTTRESRGGEHSEVTCCGWRRADYQGEQRR